MKGGILRLIARAVAGWLVRTLTARGWIHPHEVDDYRGKTGAFLRRLIDISQGEATTRGRSSLPAGGGTKTRHVENAGAERPKRITIRAGRGSLKRR